MVMLPRELDGLSDSRLANALTMKMLLLVLQIIIALSLGITGCDGDGDEGCVPDCVGRLCGDDGCGGVCGGCGTGESCEEGVCQETGCQLPDLTGRSFRISILLVTAPTDALNQSFAADIDAHVNVLIFHVLDHNREEGWLRMATGPCSTTFADSADGVAVPAAFTYALETAPYRAELDGCRFEIFGPARLDLMFNTVNKPYGVEHLAGSGTFREDGSGIDEGLLEGGIPVESTYDLCTMIPGMGVVNFHWFMTLAHLCPTLDLDGDGEPDAYQFSGAFTAEDVTDYFMDDQIIPIESLVTECLIHDQECIPNAP